MAIGVGKKFNWVQRPSTWEFAQAWRNQRAQATAKFLEQGETAVNAIASAQYNQHRPDLCRTRSRRRSIV